MPPPIIIPNKQLGKKPAVEDKRVPKFSMVQKRMIVPPASVNWYAAVGNWQMLANDTLGCCVESACLHALLQFSTYAEKPEVPSDQDAVDLYSKAAGYVPGDPSTDNGSYVLGDQGVLPYWHTTGIMSGGKLNKLTAFLQISSTNPDAWKQAIFTFGGCMFGLSLPEYIVATTETPYVWDVQGGNPPIAGGHEVWSDGYLNVVGEDLYEIVSWGERFRMTKAFMLKYVDEAAVLYDKASLNSSGLDARGLPESELLALMAGLSHVV